MNGSGQIEKKALLIVLPTEDGGVDVVKNRYGYTGKMTKEEFAAMMAVTFPYGQTKQKGK